MSALELLTIGRVSTDLYAEQLGVDLHSVRTFRKSVGGTATNVAVAAARLGHRAAVFTKVGADPFGDYVVQALDTTFGVDTSFVGRHPYLRTPLAFATMEDPAQPAIVFYREPQAPDMTLAIDEVDIDQVREVPVLWVAGGALAQQPARDTVRQVLGHRRRRRHTVLDLDWRPALWRDEAEGRDVIGAALSTATVAIGNREECRIAVGTDDPDAACTRLLDRGLCAAVVKMGGDGVLVGTADGSRTLVPPYPVDVVCGLGAGDAFGGALCHGLLAGWDLVDAVRAGNAAGAIVAGRLMCADDMPYAEEIDDVLSGRALNGTALNDSQRNGGIAHDSSQ
jgi:5-dehydro-2-deoxygluconokinase